MKDVTRRVPTHKSLLKPNEKGEPNSPKRCFAQEIQRDLVLTQLGHEGRVLICGLRRRCNNGVMNKKSRKSRNTERIFWQTGLIFWQTGLAKRIEEENTGIIKREHLVLMGLSDSAWGTWSEGSAASPRPDWGPRRMYASPTERKG